MKASKFSEAQKAFILEQGADGVPVADILAGRWLHRPKIRRGGGPAGHVQKPENSSFGRSNVG